MGQLEDLRAFVQIVELESIGKAADAAGLAKSAMSRKLRLLEQRLGTELVVRTTRQWALSDAGRLYFDRARQVISAIDDADAEIREEECELNGEVRLSVPLHYGNSVLSTPLLDFAAEHPKINLNVEFGDRMVDLIGERYDLAIRIAQLADSSSIARKLSQTSHVFCASPSYLDEYPAPVTPEELKSHRILQVGQVRRFHWSFKSAAGKSITVALKSAFNSNNGEALIAASVRGQGIIRVPDFLARAALDNGHLKRILPTFEPDPLGIYIVYPASRHLPRRVRALIDFLIKRQKDM
jgi:DNA-binding transcriptional LysR family regulator